MLLGGGRLNPKRAHTLPMFHNLCFVGQSMWEFKAVNRLDRTLSTRHATHAHQCDLHCQTSKTTQQSKQSMSPWRQAQWLFLWSGGSHVQQSLTSTRMLTLMAFAECFLGGRLKGGECFVCVLDEHLSSVGATLVLCNRENVCAWPVHTCCVAIMFSSGLLRTSSAHPKRNEFMLHVLARLCGKQGNPIQQQVVSLYREL
jgi:hypothetical protein